ncbi:MAG: efflux RND transporter periplasmic adaptor subunit [Candidatus Obscuribacterales bacterium]|nr:efflux RND transporter periplasmic adaptor subunit [Candidatus Obscuribacterales bacterium]
MASRKTQERLLAALTVLFLSVFSQGCTPSAQPAAPPVIPSMPVKLETVGEQVLDDSTVFVATLKSRKSINLKPQADGRLLEILVNSGDRVRTGQSLMILDKSKQEALVNTTDAAIEAAVSDEKNAVAMVKSLKANRLSKVANLEFANTQIERYKRLHAEGAVSAESVDEKRNNIGVAQADLEAMDAQISAQEAKVATCQKLIKQARSSKQEALEQLKYFTVKAPFEGMIGDVPVKIGDYVTTDTTLTTVDQTRPLEVYVSAPTSLSEKLRIGLTVDIVDENGKTVERGRIFFISSQVDANQQTVLLKAELPNVEGLLRSGQTAQCRVIWDRVKTVTIPVTCVSRFSGQDFVFIATTGSDGKLHAAQRLVTLGPIEGNHYRVVTGVKAGEKIVSSGIQNLSDGAPIGPSS